MFRFGGSECNWAMTTLNLQVEALKLQVIGDMGVHSDSLGVGNSIRFRMFRLQRVRLGHKELPMLVLIMEKHLNKTIEITQKFKLYTGF